MADDPKKHYPNLKPSRRSVRYGTYEEWYPECPACDDYGCPLCCETQPIDEDDLDMMGGPDDYDDPARL